MFEQLQANLIKLLYQTKSLKVTGGLYACADNCQNTRVWMRQMLQQIDNYTVLQ